MSSKAEQEEHERRSEAAKKAAETRAKNKENGENGEEHTPPSGATQTPVALHSGDVAAKQELETVPTSQSETEPDPDAEGVAGGNVADDGVEDVELGPPVLGQFVRITAGDYEGRFAVYLGNVSYQEAEPKDADPQAVPVPDVIQVRTRDADNLLLDIPYSDASSTTYSGGR